MSLALSRNRMERQAWLLYYNRTLLDCGVISEDEYRRMKVKIMEASLPIRATDGRQARLQRKTAGKRRAER